jgi:hypothetical protein
LCPRAQAIQLLPKSAGDPAFAQTSGAGDQQVLVPGDPAPVCKMRHDAAINPTRCAQVQILYAGILAKGRELEPRSKLLGVALSGLAVDRQTETFFEREDVEGGRPSLFFKRRCNASQAESRQSVMGRMGRHFGPLEVAMAAATNVGVLEGGDFFRAFKESSVEAVLQDGTDGCTRLRKNGRARMVTPRWQAASTRAGP